MRQIGIPGPVGPALQMVRRLVHERRAIADPLSDRPPIGGVRMRWVLRADSPQTVEAGVVVRVAVPELVQARVVEAQRPRGSVHLDEEVARAAGAHPRHLEHAACSTGEAGQHRRGLVNVDGATASLARKRLRLCGDLFDLSDHPQCEIDQVGP